MLYQRVSTGKFRQYDYGLVGNLLRYRRINPPDYDLSKVTAPLALYYSDNDWLSAVRVSILRYATEYCYVTSEVTS